MNWGELVFRTARALPRVSVCWSNFPSGRRSANESMMPLDGAAAHRVEISSGPRKIWPEKTLRAEPQPNVDDVAVWTELECVIFPSSQRRARSASPIGRSRNWWSVRRPSKACRTDHPVRDKSERILWFLMSRTPLLCEEGNVLCRKLCPKNYKLHPCYTKDFLFCASCVP